MSITKCTNKDSLERECNQYRYGDDCDHTKCNHLAVQYLRKGQGLSNESRRWLSSCNPKLLREIENNQNVF